MKRRKVFLSDTAPSRRSCAPARDPFSRNQVHRRSRIVSTVQERVPSLFPEERRKEARPVRLRGGRKSRREAMPFAPAGTLQHA